MIQGIVTIFGKESLMRVKQDLQKSTVLKAGPLRREPGTTRPKAGAGLLAPVTVIT